MMEQLKKEYESQDNRATAYPIYVTVQEKYCVGVMDGDYSVCCPFGDGEIKTQYKHEIFDELFDSESDLIESLKRYYEDNDKVNSEIPNIVALTMGYIWIDIEWFFTVKGAEDFMLSDKHNHRGEMRTYIHHFNRRNVEMRGLLEEIGFKTK